MRGLVVTKSAQPDALLFLQLVPGETALAFYTATNPTDKPIVGISAYNVVPYEVGATLLLFLSDCASAV